MNYNFSLHRIIHPDSISFNPSEYSRFKFGDNEISKKFGHELALGFINSYLKNNKNITQMVVISSPYNFIPTATFALKNQFTYTLNHWLSQNDLPVLQETKVHRFNTYQEDYGELNAEQRIKLISNDTFHIDQVFIKDKVLLFLDDIRITGSHERMILQMKNKLGIKNVTYLIYFAELINKNIEPQFENFLNYYSVKSLFDLDSIIENDFAINTRIVKYILNYDFEEFKIFIQNKSYEFIETLYNMSLGNNYHKIENYSKNLKYIDQILIRIYKEILI